MRSTDWLKITYLIHFANVVILPIIGLVLVIFFQLIVEIFIFGNTPEDSFSEIKDSLLRIFLTLALIYLIITIGLIRKNNLFRILGIPLNVTLFALILISSIQKIIQSESTIQYGNIVFGLFYQSTHYQFARKQLNYFNNLTSLKKANFQFFK